MFIFLFKKELKINLYICAFIISMETLLFSDETPILWTFSMRKDIKVYIK
jgi:hypothetical protein